MTNCTPPKQFNALLSNTRQEAALAAILAGNMLVALHVLEDMSDEDHHQLRKAAKTLVQFCRKP